MNMVNSYVYDASAEWTGGRGGQLNINGMPTIEFSAPPEFGGEAGKWTPEHLLVAATVSCFTATFLAIADLHKLPVESLKVNALARLEKVPGEGYRFTEITLLPEMRVPHDQVEIALKVLGKAEKNCFVAKSLKAAVQIEPKFEPLEEVAVV